MQERYDHQVRHPYARPFSLREAAERNMLVAVTCNHCRRSVHYLASDLVGILDPRRPALAPFSSCAKCKSREYIKIKLRSVHPGDFGVLIIRRPGKTRLVRDWHDAAL